MQVEGFSDVYHFQFSGKIPPGAPPIESDPDVNDLASPYSSILNKIFANRLCLWNSK